MSVSVLSNKIISVIFFLQNEIIKHTNTENTKTCKMQNKKESVCHQSITEWGQVSDNTAANCKYTANTVKTAINCK